MKKKSSNCCEKELENATLSNLRRVYQRRAIVGRLNKINVYVPSWLVNFFISDC